MDNLFHIIESGHHTDTFRPLVKTIWATWAVVVHVSKQQP